MSLSCSASTVRFSCVLRALLRGFLVLALGACGGGDGGDGLQGGITVPPPIPSPPDPNQSAPPRIGSGTGTSFQQGLIAANQTTLEAGQRAQARVNVVDGAGQGIDGNVTFSSPCATSARATISPVTNVGTGLYQVDYANINCEGQDIVTATLEGAATATVALTTIGPQVLTLSFVSSTFEQLSLAGIGGNESAELVFRVAGPQGIPVVGKQVNFSVNTQVGGASILPSRATGITDQNGNISTVLLSGIVAGPVNVLATDSESGRRGLSNDIIISTGVPQASRFSLSVSPRNPVGANDTDGVTVTLSIIASDAFGNNPTDGTRVSFVAPESGNVQNSCLLQDGACSVTWRSTSPRPADMRAQVIAFTDGAENFSDWNGNSVFDAPDGAFTDLGEPYADENEDGAYQPGEYFFDTNRNGVRDSGNMLWDGPCLEKVNPAAACFGNATVTIYATATIVMSNGNATVASLGTFPPVGTPLEVAQGASSHRRRSERMAKQ